MIKQEDFQGLNAVEYAKLTENQEIVEIVGKMLAGEIIEEKDYQKANVVILQAPSDEVKSKIIEVPEYVQPISSSAGVVNRELFKDD